MPVGCAILVRKFTEGVASLPQVFIRCFRHDIGRLVTQRIQPRACRHVVAGPACAHVVGETRRDRDQRDTCFWRFQKLRFARFGETHANTSVHQPGFFDIFCRQLKPQRAVVTRVIVGARNEVDAGPLEFVREFGVAAHVRATAFCHRVGLVVVKQHFEIGKGYVRRAQQLNQRKNSGSS